MVAKKKSKKIKLALGCHLKKWPTVSFLIRYDGVMVDVWAKRGQKGEEYLVVGFTNKGKLIRYCLPKSLGLSTDENGRIEIAL